MIHSEPGEDSLEGCSPSSGDNQNDSSCDNSENDSLDDHYDGGLEGVSSSDDDSDANN